MLPSRAVTSIRHVPAPGCASPLEPERISPAPGGPPRLSPWRVGSGRTAGPAVTTPTFPGGPAMPCHVARTGGPPPRAPCATIVSPALWSQHDFRSAKVPRTTTHVGQARLYLRVHEVRVWVTGRSDCSLVHSSCWASEWHAKRSGRQRPLMRPSLRETRLKSVSSAAGPASQQALQVLVRLSHEAV
jgi:hypothetical protein